MNSNNTAAEQRFVDAVRACGCVITGSPDVEIHHLWGSKFKHNKIHIGNYAVIALTPELHRTGNFTIDKNKRAFLEKYGTSSKHYQRTLELVAESFPASIQPPQDVINSILDWGLRN